MYSIEVKNKHGIFSLREYLIRCKCCFLICINIITDNFYVFFSCSSSNNTQCRFDGEVKSTLTSFLLSNISEKRVL